VNIEKKKKTIIPLNVLCRANPVMRLKDSLQFDDFFYLIISFDQKSALLAPLGHSWMDFPPMCLLLLNLLQFEDFFCVCVLPFKQLLPRKVKAWQKIIQINVISLITLRTHKNYEKKRLCIALFVARDFKKKPRELRVWQWWWSLSREESKSRILCDYIHIYYYYIDF